MSKLARLIWFLVLLVPAVVVSTFFAVLVADGLGIIIGPILGALLALAGVGQMHGTELKRIADVETHVLMKINAGLPLSKAEQEVLNQMQAQYPTDTATSSHITDDDEDLEKEVAELEAEYAAMLEDEDD